MHREASAALLVAGVPERLVTRALGTLGEPPPEEADPDTAICDGCSESRPLDAVHFGDDAITCDECGDENGKPTGWASAANPGTGNGGRDEQIAVECPRGCPDPTEQAPDGPIRVVCLEGGECVDFRECVRISGCQRLESGLARIKAQAQEPYKADTIAVSVGFAKTLEAYAEDHASDDVAANDPQGGPETDVWF